MQTMGRVVRQEELVGERVVDARSKPFRPKDPDTQRRLVAIITDRVVNVRARVGGDVSEVLVPDLPVEVAVVANLVFVGPVDVACGEAVEGSLVVPTHGAGELVVIAVRVQRAACAHVLQSQCSRVGRTRRARARGAVIAAAETRRNRAQRDRAQCEPDGQECRTLRPAHPNLPPPRERADGSAKSSTGHDVASSWSGWRHLLFAATPERLPSRRCCAPHLRSWTRSVRRRT